MLTVRQAIDAILGADLATAIIDDMGEHWAIVAALSDPRSAEHPEAAAALAQAPKTTDTGLARVEQVPGQLDLFGGEG